MAPRRAPSLPDAGRARVAERPLRADRLPGHAATGRRPKPRARRRRASTRSTPRSGRCSTSSGSPSPSRSGSRESRSTPSSTRCRWRPRSRQRSAEVGRHLLLVLRRGARRIRTWSAGYLGSVVPLPRQLLRHAQLGGVLRRLVLLHARGGAVPDGALDLLPDQRRRDRAVRADADRRRGRRERELPRGLHRADARREPAPRRGRRAGRPRRRLRSSTRRCRTGIRATPRARAASTTS